MLALHLLSVDLELSFHCIRLRTQHSAHDSCVRSRHAVSIFGIHSARQSHHLQPFGPHHPAIELDCLTGRRAIVKVWLRGLFACELFPPATYVTLKERSVDRPGDEVGYWWGVHEFWFRGKFAEGQNQVTEPGLAPKRLTTLIQILSRSNNHRPPRRWIAFRCFA